MLGAHWQQQALGKIVTEIEQWHLHRLMRSCYGFYLLQLGHFADRDWGSVSSIPHRISVCEDPSPRLAMRTVRSQFTDLPFADESIDFMLLPHTLEFTATPEDTLLEAYRVLAPGGHLLVMGFNPYSLLGLRLLFHRRGNGFRKMVFHSASRIKKCLKQMDGEILYNKTDFYRPPVNDGKRLHRWRWFEKFGRLCFNGQGGVYFFLVRKKVSALTPLQVSWQKRKTALAGQLLGTSTWKVKL